jgi:oxygen-independent coproporphyrinogen-3 oxidase
VPDADLASDMLDLIVERTAGAGLQRYEVSAFAREGHRCVHNLNYWQFGDYLGIGAGAHSKLSFAHRVVRQVRWREPATYMDQALAGSAVSNDEEVARAALPFEFMLNTLRLREGFELDRFTERTGLPLSAVAAALERAERDGLIERDFVRVRPTVRGFDFLSDLQALFLPPA